MSKADEMFKKLGYEDSTHGNGLACIVIYEKDSKGIGFYTDKTVDCYNYFDGYEYISMQELQAINKKVKELGWNENN